MNHAELESTYEALATKIDEVGERNSELYLAKLVLLLAHRTGSVADVMQLMDNATVGLVELDARMTELEVQGQ